MDLVEECLMLAKPKNHNAQTYSIDICGIKVLVFAETTFNYLYEKSEGKRIK